jgi:predicted kinase
MKNNMIIMVGIPGSGKSTLARHLNEVMGVAICSADKYMIDDKGEYKFDRNLLKDAHTACQANAVNLLHSGNGCIIDNTNCTQMAIDNYLNIASDYQAHILIYWFVTTPETGMRNIHGVDIDTLKRMREQQIQLFKQLTGMEREQSCTFQTKFGQTASINIHHS